jgi:hypothetical protein
MVDTSPQESPPNSRLETRRTRLRFAFNAAVIVAIAGSTAYLDYSQGQYLKALQTLQQMRVDLQDLRQNQPAPLLKGPLVRLAKPGEPYVPAEPPATADQLERFQNEPVGKAPAGRRPGHLLDKLRGRLHAR